MSTCKTAISTCDDGQQWITELTAVHEMQQQSMDATEMTDDATTSTCEEGQQRMPAARLHQEVQQWSMEATAVTYTAIAVATCWVNISACEKRQQWITAFRLLRAM